MAHTPGLWELAWTCGRDSVARIRLNGSTVYQVSDVTDPDFPSGKPRYNLDDLRLMAAAPEMLAALKVADTALDFAQAQVDSERDANQIRGWRREIQKAINTAEGRVE